MPGRRGSWLAALGGVAVRPWLWGAALGAALRLAPRGWWKRPPFVPWPDRAYVAHRLETQYGRDGAPAPHDLVSYLEWCRSYRTVIRQGRR